MWTKRLICATAPANAEELRVFFMHNMIGSSDARSI
jgi:hypothetical protein